MSRNKRDRQNVIVAAGPKKGNVEHMCQFLNNVLKAGARVTFEVMRDPKKPSNWCCVAKMGWEDNRDLILQVLGNVVLAQFSGLIPDRATEQQQAQSAIERAMEMGDHDTLGSVIRGGFE